MTAKSKTSLPLLGIFLIIALLALNVYQWFRNSQLKSNLDLERTEMFELEKIHTALDQDYQSALQDLEDMRGDNQELNGLIENQKSELLKQKQKISALIWTERELGKAREELNKMRTQAAQYMTEIKTLKEENQDLVASNVRLTQENTTLNQEVQLSKTKISKLDSARTVLSKEREKLSETNTQLSGKVDIAEAIKINFIEVKGYLKKDDGALKERARAKKVDVLRTCFVTETNIVTPAGQKEFQVRLTGPSGEVLYVEDMGSGVVTEKLTGQKMKYSVSGNVEYNNEETNACIDFEPNFNVQKGNYIVEIFNNGFIVGEGTFRLK